MSAPASKETVGQAAIGQQDNSLPNVPLSINEFSFSLYEQIGRESGNLVYSPYSIATALAMTWAGARDKTAGEMSRVLHFTGPPEDIHEQFRSLAGQLDSGSESGALLAIANALWAQEDYMFLREYLNLITGNYGAGLQNLDFSEPRACEQSRQIINHWVEERTNYKIRELIASGMLTPLTRLVLTNAIWFDGSWIYPFDKQKSREGDFHTSKDQTARVTYMNKQASFGYYEDKDYQAIQLPYQGNEVAMLVVLPRELKDLRQPGDGLTADLYYRMVNDLSYTEISLSLPRFTSAAEINLKAPLQAMGMYEAFQKEADFSGMTGNKELFIDFVIHKAFIEVDEKGTEAAAATAVGMALKSAYIEEPTAFIADHPFYYLIYHRATKLILFAGRFVIPEAG